jgi:integrase
MSGNITKRGAHSYRLKFDVPSEGGKRKTRFITFRGTRQAAKAELVRLVNEVNKGTLPDVTKITLGEYLRNWLDGKELSARSREQYADIIEKQIAPLVGKELQKLKSLDVKGWLNGLKRRDGRNLGSRTVRGALRVLNAALTEAAKLGLIATNPAAVVDAPKLPDDEVEILSEEEIERVLTALKGRRLYPIVVLALATGARRNELLALRWTDISGDKMKIERSLEATRGGGLRFKSPKTKQGRRTISLPQSALDALSQHRKEQLEIRMALGMGKPPADALVFHGLDGSPISPNSLSASWIQERKRPGVTVKFHAFRHTHASALIGAGLDIVKISRRLGHKSPIITLKTYAHLWGDDDAGAASAMDKVLRCQSGAKKP